MTLVTITVFLLNLLCSFYNCDYEHPVPTPDKNDYMKARSGRASKFFRSDKIVNTNAGAVEGFMETVSGGRDIFAFEGIPFAEPPVGNLRFRTPIPKSPWKGIRQAKAPGYDCLQFKLRAVGNEDCLYLNVYTPKFPLENEKLNIPVIVWIHGGSFFLGSGRDYGCSYLLNHDVILVTVNYRLGVLGFMSTGDDESPGNYGLKDQALAIKWVHENIEHFGGDVNRITIAGQSAGAACVHFHMISPTGIARGLFQAASSFSGTALSSWALQTPQYARKLTNKLAKTVTCPINSGSKALVDCFRRTNPNVLVGNQQHLFEIFVAPVVMFGPVIEPNTTIDAFITDTPENYYARNEVANVPFLCTNTEHESEFAVQALRNVALLLNYMINWRNVMPILLGLQGKVDNIDYALDVLTKNYMGDQDPAKVNPKLWGQLATDRYFSVPNRRALQYHSKIAPTYSYLFGFTSRVGVTQALSNDFRDWGASHTEDLSVIFNATLFFPAIKKGEIAYEMSQILTNLISNFAAKRVPYYTNSNGSDVVIWEPIQDPNNPKFLRLNTGDIKMIPDPFAERLKVWKFLGIN